MRHAAALAAANANEKVQANAIRALGYLLTADSHPQSSQQACGHQHGVNAKVCDRMCSCRCEPADQEMPGRAGGLENQVAAAQYTEPSLEGSSSAAAPNLGHSLHSLSAAATGRDKSRLPCEASASEAEQSQRHYDDGGSSASAAGGSWPTWGDSGLTCLCKALRSGSVKVQWNACYAVGALLRSWRAAIAAERSGGVMCEVLHQLLHALSSSSNFKAGALTASALDGDIAGCTLEVAGPWRDRSASM